MRKKTARRPIPVLIVVLSGLVGGTLLADEDRCLAATRRDLRIP